MNERQKNKEISMGLICPYCGFRSELINSSFVYNKSYGLMRICFKCDAYVGCHKGTDKSLGRLANSELREAKKKAHFFFDKLWNKDNKGSRKLAYAELAMHLDIPIKECHIGMFDVDRCEKTIDYSIGKCNFWQKNS